MSKLTSRAKHLKAVNVALRAAFDATAQLPGEVSLPMDAIHALDDIDAAIEALRQLRALAQASQTYLVASDL